MIFEENYVNKINNEFIGPIKRNYVIYIITNIINNKIYIGQTYKFNKRKNQHLACQNKNNMPIDRAIHKYGSDKFLIEIIETCISLQYMNDAEEFWIAYYKFIGAELYNIKKGGNNHERTIEAIEKSRRANIGRKHSEEHNAKIGIAHKGKIISEITKNKVRNSVIANNYKHTDKAKNAISLATSTAIISVDEFDNEIFFFSSIKKASEELNIPYYTISKILRNKRKLNKINGYTFKYNS